MRVIIAFLRASWLTAASYKLELVLSYAATLFSVVPLYYVSGALHPIMAHAIRHEGGQYFGFLLVGFAVMQLIPVAVDALPSAVSAAIATGTLETVLTSPARIQSVLVGMVAYQFANQLARVLLMILLGRAFGAPVQWSRLPAAVLILLLIVLSYVPFALLGASLVIAFRTPSRRLSAALLSVSVLLGGVYYPTTVIPSWLARVSGYVPLTHGLRALRQVALDGNALISVTSDLMTLAGSTALLGGLSLLAFNSALGYARRSGTLGTY